MSGVTRILRRVQSGEPNASEELLPLIYSELRKQAASQLADEAVGQTLQPTALVHEAYIRLVDSDQSLRWDSRRHFFSAAATAMRRILVENARRRCSQKRGGHLRRVDVQVDQLDGATRSDELIALDEALGLLAEQHDRKARLVELRYFGGLTISQAAQALNISIATAERDWSYSRAWLHRQLTTRDSSRRR